MTEESDSSGSFSQGVGQWLGAAEVYDPHGTYLGPGKDTRTVEADDGAGTVTVNVSFEGPFSMAGEYTIADRGTHRLYQGPLNYGFADALGPGLVAAHNYWPALGMSQRFFLMVLPNGTRQLSLALISRGESLQYVVVGEYQRQTDPGQPEPPLSGPLPPGETLLHRPGTWAGDLTLLDGDLADAGTGRYVESAAATADGLTIELQGVHFAGDTSYELTTEATQAWTPAGDVVGSFSISGGRGQSGNFLHHEEELRVWKREVASLDGTMKAVLHSWYRGEQRVGVAYGTLAFS